MSNKIRDNVCIFLFLMILLLVGCTYADSGKSRIYDDNIRIAASEDSYSFLDRKGTKNKDEVSIIFHKFYGMDTVYRINVKDDSTLDIRFDAKINKGEFKVVLINPDDTIIKILEDTTSGEIKVPLEKGVNRIKMVGREAEGELFLHLDTK